jgi:hypothetical protein
MGERVPRLKRNAVDKPPLNREFESMITARPDISLDIDGTKRVAGSMIILVKRSNPVAVHIRRRAITRRAKSLPRIDSKTDCHVSM